MHLYMVFKASKQQRSMQAHFGSEIKTGTVILSRQANSLRTITWQVI